MRILRLHPLPAAVRVDARVPLVTFLLGLTTLAAITVHVAVGEFPLTPDEVVRTLVGGGAAEHRFIVMGLRLPRALVATAVGVALGASGAIVQGLTRNPLAAPEIVGVTAGANLAAVSVLVLFSGLPAALLPVAALVGALGASAAVYVLAWRDGSHPTRLLLVGIGVSAAAQALVTAVVVTAPSYSVLQAVVWLTGSVYGRGWADLRTIAPWLIVLLPAAFVLARRLDVLQLGDWVAAGLGSNIERDRGLLLLVGVALAAIAVAVAGPIAFVGLMAPHIARRMVGPSATGLLVVSALAGAGLVTIADVLARVTFAPIEIPAGVVTPVVGVPYLILLLYRSQRHEVGM